MFTDQLYLRTNILTFLDYRLRIYFEILQFNFDKINFNNMKKTILIMFGILTFLFNVNLFAIQDVVLDLNNNSTATVNESFAKTQVISLSIPIEASQGPYEYYRTNNKGTSVIHNDGRGTICNVIVDNKYIFVKTVSPDNYLLFDKNGKFIRSFKARNLFSLGVFPLFKQRVAFAFGPQYNAIIPFNAKKSANLFLRDNSGTVINGTPEMDKYYNSLKQKFPFSGGNIIETAEGPLFCSNTMHQKSELIASNKHSFITLKPNLEFGDTIISYMAATSTMNHKNHEFKGTTPDNVSMSLNNNIYTLYFDSADTIFQIDSKTQEFSPKYNIISKLEDNVTISKLYEYNGSILVEYIDWSNINIVPQFLLYNINTKQSCKVSICKNMKLCKLVGTCPSGYVFLFTKDSSKNFVANLNFSLSNNDKQTIENLQEGESFILIVRPGN